MKTERESHVATAVCICHMPPLLKLIIKRVMSRFKSKIKREEEGIENILSMDYNFLKSLSLCYR